VSNQDPLLRTSTIAAYPGITLAINWAAAIAFSDKAPFDAAIFIREEFDKILAREVGTVVVGKDKKGEDVTIETPDAISWDWLLERGYPVNRVAEFLGSGTERVFPTVGSVRTPARLFWLRVVAPDPTPCVHLGSTSANVTACSISYSHADPPKTLLSDFDLPKCKNCLKVIESAAKRGWEKGEE